MPGPALPQAPTTTRTSPPPPAPNPTVTPPAAAVSTGGAVSSDPAVATAGSAVAGSAVAGSGAGVAGSGTVPRGEIAFGTVLAGRTTGTICAKANRPGDRLVITTTADAFGTNGVRLPAGSQIVVEMTQPEAGSEFSFRAISVQVDTALHPLYGTVRTEAAPTTDRRTSTGDDKGSVLGGAIRGAILGRILGGNRGTIIGAAGGAAAGTIAARRNSVTEHCLPSGIALSVILSAPLALGPGTL